MEYTSDGRSINGTALVGCVPSSGHTSGLRGPSPQALTLFGGVRLIDWRLRLSFLGDYRQGPRYFWECRARVGYGPTTGPTLKSPRATLVLLVGRRTDNVDLTSWIQ